MFKKYLWAFILGGVLLVLLLTYFLGRSGGKKGKPWQPLKYSPGDKESTWSPVADVVTLYEAMKYLGTNEENIWRSIEGKSPAQLIAIYNEFGNRYGEDLFEWFEDELSDDDLLRAMAYFKHIN